jgi:hypothetical protein
MRNLIGKKIKFKDLKVGAFFTHISAMTIGNKDEMFPNDVYLNVKVTPSFTKEYKNESDEHAFNSIALEDGRPKTYHPESDVYEYAKDDVYNLN